MAYREPLDLILADVPWWQKYTVFAAWAVLLLFLVREGFILTMGAITLSGCLLRQGFWFNRRHRHVHQKQADKGAGFEGRYKDSETPRVYTVLRDGNSYWVSWRAGQAASEGWVNKTSGELKVNFNGILHRTGKRAADGSIHWCNGAVWTLQ